MGTEHMRRVDEGYAFHEAGSKWMAKDDQLGNYENQLVPNVHKEFYTTLPSLYTPTAYSHPGPSHPA
jgi:hypothetical protein